MVSDPYTHWTAIDDSELTLTNVQQCLGLIQDDLWVAAACADRIVDDVEVQQALLELGVKRTDAASQHCQRLLNNANSLAERQKNISDENLHSNPFEGHEDNATLCLLRLILLKRLDKLSTFKSIKATLSKTDRGGKGEVIDEWNDDPWELTSGELLESSEGPPEEPRSQPFFTLTQFLATDVVSVCFTFASQGYIQALRTLRQRHWEQTWPYRFAILDSIPEYIHPSEYQDLLPGIDPLSATEHLSVASEPWRAEDWVEQPDLQAALYQVNDPPRGLTQDLDPSVELPSRPHQLSAQELAEWYMSRAEGVIKIAGLVHNALALIQQGAAQGIPGLDELGEELTLVSRLVYDAPQTIMLGDDWNLSQWRSMAPKQVVKAFLSHSTPESIPTDIKTLVLPYLFVLESRAERSGKPDFEISTRLLYDYILNAPLDMVASIFEASKPTLPLAQRLIRNEEDIARLALASLYGSDSLDQWSTMSRIFECLPAWDMEGEDNNEDAADSTIESLSSFLSPSTSQQQSGATEILTFFKPLPRSALSRALDMLDVHLESGEILARWGVAAPLRWFLRSNSNIEEQRSWANKMARRAGGAVYHSESLEDWEWLLEDMLKLTGDSGSKSSAFGMLQQKEVMKLYFSGLLSTGNFTVARQFIYTKHPKLSLTLPEIEDLCLTCSQDFYDNSQSGNYKFGDMKLAYDCLDVPQLNKRMIQEKEFIEATSRIASFNVMSRPGIPISPLEIRLTKDRLSLISQVLSSNSDAYKHSEVILELAHKLGYRDNTLAEIKTIAMLADSALQAEDFSRAYELCEQLVGTVVNLREQSASSPSVDHLAQAYEVVWVACLQLGRQSEFEDTEKKLVLLGRAMEFCPSEQLHDILSSWRRIESEAVESRRHTLSDSETLASAVRGPREHQFIAPQGVTSSLKARLKEFHMPSPPLLSTPDAAALASRTFRSVAANFPFSTGHRSQSSTSGQDNDAGSATGSLRRMEEDVSAQASRALSKGIGWLLGADDHI